MKKREWFVGEKVDEMIYFYDNHNRMKSKRVKGTVVQLTKYLVVIDNGYYKESYQYTEFKR